MLLVACGPSTPDEATTVSQLEKFDLSATTELSIRDRGFGPEVAASLVEHATSLKVLDASGNLLGATGATTLASLSLESLDLGPGRVWIEGNRIGSKGARGLLASPDGTLVELDLSKNQIHADAFEVVTHPLVTLIVDSNDLGDEGCIAIGPDFEELERCVRELSRVARLLATPSDTPTSSASPGPGSS